MDVVFKTREVEGGWAVDVFVDGEPRIEQDFQPNVQGLVPFESEAAAAEFGQQCIDNLLAVPEPSDVVLPGVSTIEGDI